jgi:ankyrin repeat protein
MELLCLCQIETNRNTALTLACFQGRHEVVSLLVDRKANIEHRAKVIILFFCLSTLIEVLIKLNLYGDNKSVI